jgi:ATP-dependent DNA ligase
VVDGEIVAYDADGRPSFNVLQNHRGAGPELHLCAFDLLALGRGSETSQGRSGEPRQKMRVLQTRDFAIGGYTPAGSNFDAMLVGYYEGRALKYVAKVRAGFTPALRASVFNNLPGFRPNDAHSLPRPYGHQVT